MASVCHFPLPSFPTHSFGSPPTPHLPAGSGVWLHLTIQGAAAMLGSAQQASSEAGKSPGPGPTLSPKGRTRNVGHLWPYLPDPPPSKTKSKPASLPPQGSSVHSHLCKCDGQDGQRGKYIAGSGGSGSGPHTKGCVRWGQGTPGQGPLPRGTGCWALCLERPVAPVAGEHGDLGREESQGTW